MANPKNRETVEEALRNELERDRTKTYVVEISPLGLVEMTRQNVTDGPREIITKKCPTCGGDGIVLSEASAAVEAERRLRELARTPRVQAYRVELHPRVAAALIGPGAQRLAEIESVTRRRFFIETTGDGHQLDHFAVLAKGRLEDLRPKTPLEEGKELQVKLVEVGLHDPGAGVAKVDGLDVCVASAASLVGKRVKVRIERVLDGTAYAVQVSAAAGDQPLTAEAAAEKPTRQPAKRKGAAEPEPAAEAEAPEVGEAEAPDDAEELSGEEKPKKKTRRGTRGGRKRKKKPAVAPDGEAVAAAEPSTDGAAPRIHLPPDDLGAEPEAAEEAPAAEAVSENAVSENGDEPKPKKKTRRGSRGGRKRKKKPATAVSAEQEPAA
jgi:ribonuclease G